MNVVRFTDKMDYPTLDKIPTGSLFRFINGPTPYLKLPNARGCLHYVHLGTGDVYTRGHRTDTPVVLLSEVILSSGKRGNCG